MSAIYNKKLCFTVIFSFFPIFPLINGCVCTKEEINILRQDIQHKEKTIAELLERLALKDREIGELTSELNSAKTTIEDLKNSIEKLREVDIQMEEKKMEADNRIEEAIPTGTLETIQATETLNSEEEITK